MPKIFDTEITGEEATMLAFELLKENVQKDCEAALTQAGGEIANLAQDILTAKGHVKTGTLRRSIQSYVTINAEELSSSIGSFPPGARGYFGSDAPYAPYVEALPDGGFLGPAYYQLKDKVNKWLADAILVRITKVRAEASL